MLVMGMGVNADGERPEETAYNRKGFFSASPILVFIILWRVDISPTDFLVICLKEVRILKENLF